MKPAACTAPRAPAICRTSGTRPQLIQEDHRCPDHENEMFGESRVATRPTNSNLNAAGDGRNGANKARARLSRGGYGAANILWRERHDPRIAREVSLVEGQKMAN